MSETTLTTPAPFWRDPLRNERLRAALDHPLVFNLSQLLISGGQRATKRWARAWLNLRAEDCVLDVCCGTGEYVECGAPDAEQGSYLGVDLNAQYIAYAQQRYGGRAGVTFEAVDATQLQLPAGSFDRALFCNSMHHFPDELNRGILHEIARVLRPGGHLVLIDMVGDHPGRVQRFFLDRDRGHYLRPLAAQLALVEEAFTVQRYDTFDTGFTPQTIILAKPKELSGERWAVS